MAIGSESTKIKSRKLSRMSFRKNFILQNFLAIRYPLTAITFCQVSESYGSSKTNFTALKEKSKHLFSREQRSKYTNDDF